MGLLEKLKNAWNAFRQVEEPTYRAPTYINYGYSSSSRPDRMYFTRGNDRSIITAVYTRMAVDVAMLDFKHVRTDEENRYLEDIDSGLNGCLTLEANKDQTARAFIQDAMQSLFDEGCIALVPIDTDKNPDDTSSYDILSMRVGKITQWMPDHVRVEVYNDRKGFKQEIVMPKADVAIIENPLYSIMNAPNSTLQRLIRKLNLLDAIDEQSGSGKLDLIIQLPYIIKTDARRQQADKRRKDIEEQLSGSKYGIAYTDGTEKITQLNRPVDNNLLNQITYLTSMLYSQLGIDETILNGTADPKTMLNYMNRTIKPLAICLVDEMKRKFLTSTARSQKQTIMYFSDPFALVPVDQLAELADKFTRNEIISPNEFRQKIGLKPAQDPAADELRNRNINAGEGEQFANTGEGQEQQVANTDYTDEQSGTIGDMSIGMLYRRMMQQQNTDIAHNELYHHGILGQKWGIRRYQNPDGTLTEEGKIRYRKFNDAAIAKNKLVEDYQPIKSTIKNWNETTGDIIIYDYTDPDGKFYDKKYDLGDGYDQAAIIKDWSNYVYNEYHKLLKNPEFKEKCSQYYKSGEDWYNKLNLAAGDLKNFNKSYKDPIIKDMLDKATIDYELSTALDFCDPKNLELTPEQLAYKITLGLYD